MIFLKFPVAAESRGAFACTAGSVGHGLVRMCVGMLLMTWGGTARYCNTKILLLESQEWCKAHNITSDLK